MKKTLFEWENIVKSIEDGRKNGNFNLKLKQKESAEIEFWNAFDSVIKVLEEEQRKTRKCYCYDTKSNTTKNCKTIQSEDWVWFGSEFYCFQQTYCHEINLSSMKLIQIMNFYLRLYVKRWGMVDRFEVTIIFFSCSVFYFCH